MPVTWGFRGLVFTLSVVDVVTNQEIEEAVAEALANAPSKTGFGLLWDASASLTPVSSETWRGALSWCHRSPSAASSCVWHCWFAASAASSVTCSGRK